MTVLLYVLGVALLVAGMVGLVLPVIPGALLLPVGVLVLAWAGDFAVLGWGTVVFSVVVGAAILAVDWASTVLGAKAFGASRWAVIGSAVGLVVGLFLGPLGIVLGPAVGAILFELAKDPDVRRAARAGVGTLVGFVVGSILKIVLAFVLLGVVAGAYLFR